MFSWNPELPVYTEIYHFDKYREQINELKERDRFESLEEVMEKIAILSLIYNREFRTYLDMGVNPLESEIFGGLYKHFDIEIVESILEEKNMKYRNILFGLLAHEIQRLPMSESKGRTNIIPCIYIYIFIYSPIDSQAISNLDNRLNKEYKFVANSMRDKKQFYFCMKLLTAQILVNIKKKELQGINQDDVKMHLERIHSGQPISADALTMYHKLIAEANADLSLVKLPNFFKQFKDLLKERTRSNIENVLGEDPNIWMKRNLIQKQAQNEEKAIIYIYIYNIYIL